MPNIYITEKLDQKQNTYLLERWKLLAQKLHIPSSKCLEIYQLIQEKYGEKHRKYHNLSHIYSMLLLAEQEHKQFVAPDLLALAIWFHDIIYNAKRKDNEQKSADFARKLLVDYYPTEKLDLLEKMIVSTKKHVPLADFSDIHWLLDFDLAVLAADRPIYEQYTLAIRQEYKIFPNLIYKPGRRKVLTHFLNMDAIYYTDSFRSNYETLARENLNWEISRL